MPDTEALLQDWKAKTDAATKGPWWETYLNSRVIESDERIIVDSFNDGVGAGVMERADAEFIVTARTAMPKLLAAVEAIRALHRPTQVGTRSMCRNCALPFPCATTRALDAALSGSEPDERGER